jgi:hypothetical protein
MNQSNESRSLYNYFMWCSRGSRNNVSFRFTIIFHTLYISAVASMLQCFNLYWCIIIDALPKVSFQKTKYWNKPVGLKHRIFNTYLGVSEEIQRPTTIATLMK